MLLAFFLFITPLKSYFPRIAFTWSPIKSFDRPPEISSVECFCILCPSPGIFTVKKELYCKTLTFAIFLFAEFGFLGDIDKVFQQTAFFWGFIKVFIPPRLNENLRDRPFLFNICDNNILLFLWLEKMFQLKDLNLYFQFRRLRLYPLS